MKLFASDFDGTFTAGNMEENLAAVRRWREAGNLFAIVTGRDYTLAADCRDRCGDVLDFLVCCNGAAIYDKDGNLLLYRTVPAKTVRKVWELAEKYRAVILAICRQDRRDYLPLSFSLEKTTVSVEDCANGEPICQMTALFQTVEEMDLYVEELNRAFEGVVTPQCNGRNCDAPAAPTTKSLGVQWIADLAGCTEIYTIGDNGNDVPMIRDFYGFSLTHGVEETRQVSKECVTSVAEAIDRLMNRP